MNKLKELLNTYFWLIVAVWLILIFAFVFWLSGRIDTNRFDKKVNQQTNQANTAVKQAANAQNAAVNADIERRTEDAVRTQTITPKLNNVRRQSQNSKAALDAAKRQYENAKNNPENLSVDSIGNCRKLGELFPNVRFDDCR